MPFMEPEGGWPDGLGFLGDRDCAAIVEAAVRTGTVGKFLRMAIRAFRNRRRSGFVVRAALASAGLGMTTFWVRHTLRAPC